VKKADLMAGMMADLLAVTWADYLVVMKVASSVEM
jgi:hypothetical protein